MKKDLELSRNYRVSSRGCTPSVDPLGFKPYVNAWESELQAMCAEAAQRGCIETGGDLYGLSTHARRPVIMLVTGPGSKAIHRVTRFTQDVDFLKRTNTFLRNTFGLQLGGNYHLHHLLGINEPSSTDIQSTNSIAQKNGYQRFVQFVLTFEKDRSSNFPSRSEQVYDEGSADVVIKRSSENNSFKGLHETSKVRFAPSSQFNFIRIHSFIYLDAAHGKPIRCPIRVLRGTSPFRRAVLRNSIIPDLAKPYTFPMDRILVDSFTLPEEPRNQPHELPTRISEQWLQLPENIREDTGVSLKNGLIVLSIPIPPAERRVFVGYNVRAPHRVEAVFLSQNEKTANPIDVSKEALCFGPFTRLGKIYEKIGCLVDQEILTVRRDNSTWTDQRYDKTKEQEVIVTEKNPKTTRKEIRSYDPK
jgi:hypothetical protein